METLDKGMSRAEEVAGAAKERGAEAYEKAQQAAGQAYQKASEAAGEAYDRTSRTASGAYDQAVGYGRENPALMTLITLGVGVGIGILLASSLRRSESGSYSSPIVDAVYDFSRNLFR